MKRFLFTFFILSITTIFVYGQSERVDFTINLNCEYEVPNSEKNFYVINFENVSQTELYTKALMAISKQFVSPKDAISKVENSLISVNSVHTISYLLADIIPVKYIVNYVFKMEFREGRMKIDPPYIASIMNGKGEHLNIEDCILSRNKDSLSGSWQNYLFVNDIINNILSEMSNDASEDW